MPQVKPKRPSADKTRKAILNVARKLFAQHGFAGTSISDIAKPARINQSLIYHHFGNKEGLWRQVKADMLSETFNVTEAADLEFTSTSLEAFVTDFVSKRFLFYLKYPEVYRMILWQRLEGKDSLHGTQEGVKPSIEKVCQIIKKLQSAGELRKDIRPEFALNLLHNTSTDSLENFLFPSPPNDLQELNKQYLKFIIDSILRALRPK